MSSKKNSTSNKNRDFKSRFFFRRRPSPTRRRSQRDRINYGVLEDRLALATFIVTTAADTNTGVADGFVSLREAVQAANTNTAYGDAPAGDPNGDVIRFDPSIYNSTIFLTKGQINIFDDMLIQGGDSNITISGLGITRLFDVAAAERVGFSKLTFDNGNSAVGSAMYLIGSGTTLLFETNFTNHRATGLGGGAIYYAHGNLFITDSTFTGNQATNTDGSGGAIYQASGNIFARGGLMDTNTAGRSGGAIAAVGGTFSSVNLTVGTLISGNRAVPVGSPTIFSDGGGLHVSGTARATIQGGEFVGNLAARNGGGMYVGLGGQLFVRPGTEINNNHAGGSAVGQGGGGIFNSGARLYVNQATISLNSARGTVGSGGGIYAELGTGKTVLNLATVDNNAARRSGGGIHIKDGLLQLTNSNVTNNDVGTTIVSATGRGGGIYAEGNATVVVNDGQVANNSATLQGGGIWSDTRSLVFLRNFASVGFNSVSGVGARGGGIYSTGFLQAKDSVFQRNVATTAGGGLYLSGAINARIDNVNFFENNGGNLGGGIFNNSSMFITNVTFAGNVVGVDGGAYFTATTATTLAQGLSFSGNLPNDTN